MPDKFQNRQEIEPRDVSLLETMHPRHVCWILAVAAGVKPSAMIESVDADKWEHFTELMGRLGLCFAYTGQERTVIGLKPEQIDFFGGQREMKAKTHAYLSFNVDNWQKWLHYQSAHFNIHEQISADLAPATYKGLDVQDVFISNHPARLMDLIRSSYKGLQSGWDAQSAGKALGYPACCIESYNRLGSSGAAPRLEFFKELIAKGMDQSMPLEFWSIFHVPCSTSCQRSIELGRAYLEAIRAYSDSLFNSVIQKFRCSHLAYSVGERFLDYDPLPDDSYGAEPERRKEILEKSRTIIGSAAEVELGNIRRPLLYVDEQYGEFRFNLTPKIMGPKWIAYSPGNGAFIQDAKTDEVFLYVKAEILGEDSMRFRDTAFRVYRSI